MNGAVADTARETAALTTLLVTEYGVIYGLASGGGQLAPRTAGTGSAFVPALASTTTTYDEHRLRRDRLIAVLQARQATVPVALSAYRVTRSDQPAVLLGYLAELAQTTIVAYRAAIADLVDPALRTDAVAAVIEAARYRTAMLHAAGQSDDAAAPALPG